MKRFSFVLAGVSAMILSFPSLAAADRVGRNMRAYPVDAAVFEVIPRTASGAGDYWCGASDYAQRVLGASWTDPLFVVRGRGPSATTGRKSAVQFTLDPVAAGLSGAAAARANAPLNDRFPIILTNRLSPGDHMSVQQARSYCDRNPARP
ncbi:hypothetical protein [Pseudodonghicola flavimaris]|uniref:Uncharacterized protein n=1 Tax=Pseudodonghicola flavimaris TaxID=3050036 RepID=A0ABT7F4E6_9RHOB|nr:hypothetical protein [Pseudodonghicola flavimaris]MDK3019467.1 hypothetical protein [Pseudodonghicola flavimaris]